jgi:hypothetical protein
VEGVTDFGAFQDSLVASDRMFATVTLLTLVNSVSGTPYISGWGLSPGDGLLGPGVMGH